MSGWSLIWPERPWTANDDRANINMTQKAARTRKWRQAYQLLAAQAGIPHLEAIQVTVTQYRANSRGIPDVASCFPAAKAAIDGLVDAGVIDDDSPRYVKRVTFESPIIGDPDIEEGMEILVTPWRPPESP